MSDPTDIEICFFRFRCYNASTEEYYHYSCGTGSAGLDVGQRFLSVTEGVLEYAAAFPITVWDFDESSLPARSSELHLAVPGGDRHDHRRLAALRAGNG